jgi:hypothetical protein
MASHALSEDGNAALLEALRDSGSAAAREERVLKLLAAALPRGVTPVPAPASYGGGEQHHDDSPGSRGKASPQASAQASYWTSQQLQLANSPQRPPSRSRAASPVAGVCDDLALALVEERVHWRAEAVRVADDVRRLEEEREALRESADALARARDAFRAECAMERAATEAERREVADALVRLEARVCAACAQPTRNPNCMRHGWHSRNARARTQRLRPQADARVAASEHAALEARAHTPCPHSTPQRAHTLHPHAKRAAFSLDKSPLLTLRCTRPLLSFPLSRASGGAARAVRRARGAGERARRVRSTRRAAGCAGRCGTARVRRRIAPQSGRPRRAGVPPRRLRRRGARARARRGGRGRRGGSGGGERTRDGRAACIDGK